MKRSFHIIVACIIGFFMFLGVAAWRAHSPATPEDISKAVASLTPDQRKRFGSVMASEKKDAFSKFNRGPFTRHDLKIAIESVTDERSSTQIADEQDAALRRALQNGDALQK